MVNKSLLFRTAWAHARVLADRQGFDLRDAFAIALRQAWARLRQDAACRAALAAATADSIARIRATKAAGVPVLTPGRWRFANASLNGGM